MPDEYDAFRRELSNYEKGLYFELGRAHMRDETPEKGWVRQFAITIDGKSRILDSARTDGKGTRSVERKSGRVNERETRKQLSLERSGLESGKLARSRWETVAGEKIPDKVREDMQALARDFPGRFHHEIVSRADALRAIQIGKSMVAKQLELVPTNKLLRAERARKRLEKLREIVRTRETRQPEREREERTGVERGAAERVVREFRSRDERTEARTQQPSAPPPTPQRTPEQERENARTVAKDIGIPQEIVKLLGLNSNAPYPTNPVIQARTHDESVANRSKHQQRERERTERERDSRHRGE